MRPGGSPRRHHPNARRALNITVDYWLQMVDLAPGAPLFDLASFANRLTSMVELLVDADRYDELTQKVDDLLAARTGRHIAARARVERAQKLIKMDRLLLGVRELNRAKHDWFSKETIGISAAALIDLSSHYSAFGLVYAAKYYALAAAWVVLQVGDDRAKRLVRPALVRAGECDYEAGAWLEALDFFSVAQRADAAFSVLPMTLEDPEVEDSDSDLRRILLYSSYILAVSKGQPDLVQKAVAHKIAEWPDRDVIEHTSIAASKAFYEIATTPGGEIQEHLAMPPFIDAAPIRRFEWSALGVNWLVIWPNNLGFTLMAEQFMAVLQLLIADLALSDLYILPGRVAVRFSPDKTATERKLHRIPSNEASVWEMCVPANFSMDDRARQHRLDVGQSMMLLHELSLRPEKWPVLERLAAVGPYANTMVGELYTRLYRSFCDADVVALDSEHRDPNLAAMHLRRETHPELAWNRELIEEYKADDVRISLSDRYQRLGAITKHTLPRLLANPSVNGVLRGLRQEGWLDWQILAAIFGVASNYCVQQAFNTERNSPKELRALMDMYIRDPEDKSWQEVPPTIFTRDRLHLQMVLNTTVVLKGAGLVLRQQTPNQQAVLDFARHKMRYFSDDMPHDDILAVSPAPSTVPVPQRKHKDHGLAAANASAAPLGPSAQVPRSPSQPGKPAAVSKSAGIRGSRRRKAQRRTGPR